MSEFGISGRIMCYFFGGTVKVLVSVQTNVSVHVLACNGFIVGRLLITNCVSNMQWMQNEPEGKTFFLVLLSCCSPKLLIAVQHFGSSRLSFKCAV